MDLIKSIERIVQLHSLVKTESTGTPDNLAGKLGISRATLYRIMEELKSYNAPIEYSRIKKSFYYSKVFEFELNCTLHVIDEETELKKIIGGYNIFSSVSILRRKEFIFVSA